MSEERLEYKRGVNLETSRVERAKGPEPAETDVPSASFGAIYQQSLSNMEEAARAEKSIDFMMERIIGHVRGSDMPVKEWKGAGVLNSLMNNLLNLSATIKRTNQKLYLLNDTLFKE